MKKFLSILFTFLYISNSGLSQSGWNWLNPLPQGNSINCVIYKNTTTLYAVTSAGAMLNSTDGGLNWIFLQNISSQTLNSIAFFDDNTGFACGNSGEMLKTTNSGVSWVNQNFPVTINLSKLCFVNSTTGFVTTSYGVYRTTNKGINWNSVYSGPTNSISFANANTGYIVYDVAMYKTTNGGANWFLKASSFSTTLKAVCFKDVNTGVVSGYYSFFSRTTDGGTSWVSHNYTPLATFLDVKSYDTSTFTAIGYFGNIAVSVDAGLNWNLYTPVAHGRDLYSLASNGNGSMCAAGYAGEIVQSDNPYLGHNVISYNRTRQYSVFFTDINNGFICNDAGEIIKTTNSGVNWVTVFSGSANDQIKSIFFVNQNTGFTAGNGQILKTTNSGLYWNYMNPSGLYNLNAITFIDEYTGFAAGPEYSAGNSIIRTTNSGTNWNRVYNNTVIPKMKAISFGTHDTGYVCTDMGYIVKTTNAGLDWNIVNWGLTNYLFSIYFINGTTGFTTGDYGHLLKTTTGGVNWISYNTSGTYDINSVFFVNANTGYAVGGTDNMVICKTTNTGQNWIIHYYDNATNLNSVFFVNANTGFAIGDLGTILKTTTGGEPIAVQQISNEIPKSFELHQNYPNPFNPTTKISFTVPKSGLMNQTPTRLIIYDITGREVVMLINEQLSHGTYETTWDASNYASGVYFYQLTTEGFSLTKKMVLLK